MLNNPSTLSSFGRAKKSQCQSIRPDNEIELVEYMTQSPAHQILARGAGLSYNDSGFNTDGIVIDTKRINHFNSFDPTTGIVECQGHVTFKDLFSLHPDFIPPVIPGTIHATLAGGIAHDIHGKNNHHNGTLGQHIIWMDIVTRLGVIRCSREEHPDLFYATIAGMGLTGFILRIGLRLKAASRSVQVETFKYESLPPLLNHMSTTGLDNDYQVAWLDLLNLEPRAILSVANHVENTTHDEKIHLRCPKFPFRLINGFNMKRFNQRYFKSKKHKTTESLLDFNNPLDRIEHWDRLYGPKGLVQFQAVFDAEHAGTIFNHILQVIRRHQATPTLCVLKLFTQPGEGVMSFCTPGYTLAIDFINNKKAHKALLELNDYITEISGKIYLAKDLLLTPSQFERMYPSQEQWQEILRYYESPMRSDLSQRLGITYE